MPTHLKKAINLNLWNFKGKQLKMSLKSLLIRHLAVPKASYKLAFSTSIFKERAILIGIFLFSILYQMVKF